MARPDLQEKSAGIQDVTYQTDQQTLILNTATAYFNVLSAIDALLTEAQKQAIYRQLDQTTQRFNVVWWRSPTCRTPVHSTIACWRTK
jgi:outer membrane protein TolC